MENTGVYHYDDDDYYVYGHELHSERTLMPDSPTTPPTILHLPPRDPQNKYCKYF